MSATSELKRNKYYEMEPINGEVCDTLFEVLRLRTVSELRSLAARHGVRGCWSLKKVDLIGVIQAAILEGPHMEEELLCTGKPSWQLFRRIAADGGRTTVSAAPESYTFLQKLGYLQAFSSGDQLLLMMPLEVRQAYQALLKNGFLARKERDGLIHSYACAAVNLYGVISQEAFIALFNNQNGKKLSHGELHATLGRHTKQLREYVLWQDYIINEAFCENDYEDVRDLLARIGDTPRYVPLKQELLKYADPDYFEATDYTRLMEHYLRTDTALDEDKIPELMQQLVYAIMLEYGPYDLLAIMKDYGVIVSPGELGPITDLLVELSNSTRIWSLNGHTRREMSQIRERNQRRSAIRPGKNPKTGRNDPCPCGSGKKYKKCCGR